MFFKKSLESAQTWVRTWIGLGLFVVAATTLGAGEHPVQNSPVNGGLLQTADAEDSMTTEEKTNMRLTYRYSNPVNVRFVRSLSTDRGVQWFQEVSRLIDNRHIEPATYQNRVVQAATNLWYGVGNPAFLEAAGIRPTQPQIDAFRGALRELIRGRQVKTAQDAMNMMYWISDLANRHVRLPQSFVIAEFGYGSAESLDQYSTFVPEEVAGRPSATLEDHVVGIGVEIKLHELGALIAGIVPATPAEEAGLRKNDVIVSVNGSNLRGKPLEYTADLITGPIGTQVLVGVEREGQGRLLVTVTRRRVPVHSVTDVQMIDTQSKVGYLRLTKFAKSSSEEMDKALWELHRQGMTSLIIDLRGNPGGLLTTAIELTNKFLPCGTIVSTRGRLTVDNSMEQATYERTWKVPLLVLIDGDSASASEIFAAAIQDNQRGLVVGRKSYGKGTVQTHFPLQTVSGSLKLTTAKFYSPTGRTMAGAGVTPDVMVQVAASNRELDLASDADVRQAIQLAGSEQVKELAQHKDNCQTGSTSDWRLRN